MANEPNYSSNPSKDEPKKEKVRVIPLEYIDEFPGHPFKVLDDESMQKLMNSIEEIGVQSPIVARIKEDQRYEIISGHRRVHACRRLGLKLIPAIVRDLSRDEAIIAMVDANLQREHILPSEKAAAYKMKMDAMKRTMFRRGNSVFIHSSCKTRTSRKEQSFFRMNTASVVLMAADRTRATIAKDWLLQAGLTRTESEMCF